MSINIGVRSQIDSSVKLSGHLEISIGKYCQIGPGVEIQALEQSGPVVIGDCCRIGPNTRILVGPAGFSLGDWAVVHESVLFICRDKMSIGHNFWLGRHALLDSTGVLEIHNGVRVGAYSQIWTHVESGELLEGSLFASARKTVLEDDVWLVGSCVVGSGVAIGKKAVCLIGSVVTKSLYEGCVYSGVPAVQNWKIEAWRKVEVDEKLDMIEKWAHEFALRGKEAVEVLREEWGSVIVRRSDEKLIFTTKMPSDRPTLPNISWFDLSTKLYTKRLTQLERDMYSFLYGNKARFIPLPE